MGGPNYGRWAGGGGVVAPTLGLEPIRWRPNDVELKWRRSTNPGLYCDMYLTSVVGGCRVGP